MTSSRHTKVSIQCKNCKKSVMVHPCEIRNGNGKFCSKVCFYEKIRKHDVVILDGIRYNFKPIKGYYENVRQNKKLHKEVWKKVHGNIPDGYDIHHIDGDKGNNDISNLSLLTHGDHSTLHLQERGFNHLTKIIYAI